MSFYLYYYVCALILNAVMVSLYSVQSFTSSPACMSAGSTSNITVNFEHLFFGGFVLHIINFTYYAFGEPIARQFFLNARSREPNKALNFYLISTAIFEVMLRVLMVVLTALELILVLSKYGRMCVYTTGILLKEGNWLLSLALSQLVLMVALAIWKADVHQKD